MTETVMFCSSLYTMPAIEQTVEAFAELAEIKVADETGHFVVQVSPSGSEIDENLIDEFCNHVLFNTAVERRRQARGDDV